MTKGTVSIIIPVYNVEEYLDKCLQSILYQTVPFDEIIIINDGSTDKSIEICERYKKSNKNIILVNQPNQGLSVTRNIGIQLATSEYIMFLDSDDYLNLDACKLIKERLLLDIEVLYYSGDIKGGKLYGKLNNPYLRDISLCEKKMTGADFFNLSFPQNWIVSACMAVYSKRFLIENKLNFIPDMYYEDNFFSLQVLCTAKQIISIEDIIYFRLYRNGSITMTDVNYKKCEDMVKVQAKTWSYIYNINYHKLYPHLINNYITFGIFQAESIINKKNNNNIKKYYRLKLVQYFLKYWQDILYENKNNINGNAINVWINKITLENHTTNLQFIKVRDGLERCIIKKLSILPLNEQEKKIAIYGMGKHTQILLKLYYRFIGNINANISFIVSEKQVINNKKFQVIYINDLKDEFDNIIISSKIYQNEMFKELKNKKISKKKIISLYKEEDFVDLIFINYILDF